MMHPLELYEIDIADEDTPRATHSSQPIVKVWNGTWWVNCNDISSIQQVTQDEPQDDGDDEYPITSKADKRRREKTINFNYKQHTNVYLKDRTIGSPTLILAAPAPKNIKPPRGDINARIARSKAVLHRPDKTAFGPEEDYDFKPTHPRRQSTTWDNLGMIPPGNYYPTGRVDFWPRGATCKPVRRSFVDILNTW